MLTELNLARNGIDDAGAVALASALRVNGVLTELDLDANGIDDAGAEALASALRVNEVLKTLDLSYNRISAAGAAAIADALEVNGVPRDVISHGNAMAGWAQHIVYNLKGYLLVMLLIAGAALVGILEHAVETCLLEHAVETCLLEHAVETCLLERARLVRAPSLGVLALDLAGRSASLTSFVRLTSCCVLAAEGGAGGVFRAWTGLWGADLGC